jgi:hypothetical protein
MMGKIFDRPQAISLMRRKFLALWVVCCADWFFDPSGFWCTRTSNFLPAQKVTKNAFYLAESRVGQDQLLSASCTEKLKYSSLNIFLGFGDSFTL